MCLYPKIVFNPKYKANKKNGGKIPPLTDDRVKHVPIGCGKCIECAKKKAREWQVRLTEEIKTDKTGRFMTMTFSEKSLESLRAIAEEEIRKMPIKKQKNIIIENEIARIATRKFLERWRAKHGKSVKHWLITELGHKNTERIHIHGIIFTNECKKEIEDRWSYGWIDDGKYVNERTINYITKYITKTDIEHKGYQPKIMTSAGIGKGYIESRDSTRNKYKKGETNEAYEDRKGYKKALPIYYRNKIYTDEEREKLWIEKLDKQERWVGGEKISIKNGEETYYKTLKHYQSLNKRLGYGDDTKEWSVTEYQEQRLKLREKNNDWEIRYEADKERREKQARKDSGKRRLTTNSSSL